MQTAFGSGVMFATPLFDAYGNAIAAPTPLLVAILQNVGLDISMDTKELHGQQNFPIDIGRAKGKFAGKASAAQISAAQFNALVFGQTVTDGQILINRDQTGTVIPAANPYQITPTPPNSGTWQADLGVINLSTGQQLRKVVSAPATGQYSVSAGVYTFAAADTGQTVLINYRYSISASGKTLTVRNLDMGEVPVFAAELWLKKNGKGTYIRIPNCVSSKFGLETKQDDFVIPNFEFSGFADAAGNIAYISTSE